jgi:hypothetical protein
MRCPTLNCILSIVGCDDFDSKSFDLVEQGYNHFFGQEKSIKSQPELNSTVTEWRFCSQIVESAHDPIGKHVLCDCERIPGFQDWRGAVAEDGSDA